MAQRDTPNDGEPYNPMEDEPGTPMQISDPMAELRPKLHQSGSPAAISTSLQVDRGPQRKKLVHPFPLGQVHDHGLNPPRQVIGQAANPKAPSKTFEISVLGNGAPCVQSNQSGNFWIIGWDMLIKLALAEGIERFREKPKPKLVDVTGRPLSSE